MGAFDGIQFAKYRPTYTGLPVDQFVKTAQEFNTRYENAIDGKDKIEAMLANTPAAEVNQPILKDIANGINSDLRSYIQQGNWEDAPLAIKQTAQKHITTNPLYKGVVMDYQNRQQFQKDVEDQIKTGKYSDDWGRRSMAMQFDILGKDQVTVDPETGALKNVFQGILPPEEIDLNKLALEVGAKVEKTTDISQLQGTGLESLYKQVKLTGRNKAETQAVITEYLMTDPKVKSYLEYKANLDHYSRFGKNGVVTAKDLTDVGFTIDNEGGIYIKLPTVPEIDDNGNKTGRVIDSYSDKYGDIGTMDPAKANALWKEKYKTLNLNAPIDLSVRALTPYTMDVNYITDHAALQRTRFAHEEMMRKKDELPTMSYDLMVAGAANKYDSYTKIRETKDDYTKNYLTDINKRIMSSNLTSGQKATLKYLIEKGDIEDATARVDGDSKAEEQYWGDNIDFARKAIIGMQIKKQQFDVVNELDTQAKAYAEKLYGKKFVDAITPEQHKKYMEEANIEAYAETKKRFGPQATIQGVNKKLIQEVYDNILYEKNPMYKAYNEYLKKNSEATMSNRSVMTFGDMTPQQSTQLTATLKNMIMEGVTSGGALKLTDAKTGEVIEDDDVRKGYVNKSDPANIGWMVVNGRPAIVIRPITDDKTQAKDKYIIVEGINNLDGVLSRFGSNARFIAQENFANQVESNLGMWTELPNTNIKVRLVNYNDRQAQPTGWEAQYQMQETINGKLQPIVTVNSRQGLYQTIDGLNK